MKKFAWQDVLTRYSNVRRRHRYAALAAVLPALCAAFYLGSYADLQAQQAGLEATVEEGARQRAEKQAYIANTKAYGEQLHALEGQLRAAHVVLPDEAEVPQFLAQLGTMAHDTGLALERFEPKPEQARDFYSELSFHLQVRGSYHQVASFIGQIGAMARIVNVSNLSMAISKGDARQPLVDGEFDVKIFRLLSDDEQAAAAKKAPGANK